ncbi:hypothetical protein Tco_1033069 [Tanacetum coccineum]|uniref:Uncharacterized protein n=1 Tax=Tanacetum coccineum TaxID=301880 RepID=A0ABQ5GDL8_9ASTR
MASNPKNVRLTILAKLQEALDEEDVLADQILTMMHRYADRFTNRRVEINNLMVLQDHPLVDYGKYALGCMTGADMKKCVYLKSVRDELLRSMEEKRQLMANYIDMYNPENVRLSVLAKLQEALDEEDILADQILTMMHRYADRFTNRRVEINNLMVLQDHPLVDYGKYALGCMTGADMKKCVYLKSVRDELLRSMEEKRQLMANYRDM